MSTRALTYVFYNVHIRPGTKLVLLAIADTADDDGDNAWPSIATLARKASVHPRSVQRAINELVKLGLLTVVRGAGPPGTNYYRVHMPPLNAVTTAGPTGGAVHGHRVVRERRRADVPEDDDSPAEPGQIDAGEGTGPRDRSVDNHVDEVVDNVVDNPSRGVDTGVANRHPGELPGVTGRAQRGDISPRGGDTSATRTSQEPKNLTPARVRAKRHPSRAVDGLRRDDEGQSPELDARRVLTELGPGWSLSPAQVDALVPATLEALRCGWAVDELIPYLSARPDGVRSPVAVLTTRLRDAAGPTRRSRPGVPARARPPWCGDTTCDPDTRIRDPGDGPRSTLYRCPVCHPRAAHQ